MFDTPTVKTVGFHARLVSFYGEGFSFIIKNIDKQVKAGVIIEEDTTMKKTNVSTSIKFATKLINRKIDFTFERGCITEVGVYLKEKIKQRFFGKIAIFDRVQVTYNNDGEIAINLLYYRYNKWNGELYVETLNDCDPIQYSIRIDSVDNFDEAQQIKTKLQEKLLAEVYPNWKSIIGRQLDNERIGGVLY